MRVRSFALAAALLCLPLSVAAQSDQNAEVTAAVLAGLSKLGYAAPADGQGAGWTAAGHFLEDLNINSGGEPSGDLPVLRALLTWQEQERDLRKQAVFAMPPLPETATDLYMLSADGRIAVTVQQKSLTLWNATEHRPVREIVGHCCIAAADLSADGTLLAYSMGDQVRVVDIRTDRVQADFDPKEGTVSAIRLAPSNDALLVGYNDGTITITTLKDGKTRLVGDHLPDADAGGSGGILSIGVSPDGSSAVSISPYDGRVKVWDIATGEMSYNFAIFPPRQADQSGHKDATLDTTGIVKVAFDSTGKSVLVLYVRDNQNGGKAVPTMQRIDLAADVTLSLNPDLSGFAISAGGETIAVSTGKEIGLFSAADIDMKFITSFPAHEVVKAVDATGKSAMVDHWNGETLTHDSAFYDLRTHQPAPLTRPTLVASSGFAVSGDEAFLAVEDGQLLAVSLASGQVRAVPVKIPEGVDDPAAIDFSGSGIDPTGVLRLSSGSRIGGEGDETSTDVIAIDPKSGSVGVGKDVTPLGALGKGYENVAGPVPARDGLFAASIFERLRDGRDAEALVSLVDLRSYTEIARWPISPRTKGAVGRSCVGQSGCTRAVTINVPILRDMMGFHAPVAFSGTGKYVLAGFWEPAISAVDVATGKTAAVFKTDVTYQQLGLTNVGPGMGQKGGLEPAIAEATARRSGVPAAIAPVPGSDDFVAVLSEGPEGFSIARRFSFGAAKPNVDLTIPDGPTTAAVSPDGAMLALGYASGMVVVVNANTGAAISVLLGNRGLADTMVFSSDGKRLYTSAEAPFVQDVADGAFRVWDVASAALLTTTFLSKGSEWVTVTPEGFFTASPKGADILTVRLGTMATASIASVRKALERPDLVAAKITGDPDGKVAAAATTLDLAALAAAAEPPAAVPAPPASPSTESVPPTAAADAPTGAAAAPAPAVPPPATQPSAPTTSDSAVEIAFWNSIVQSKNPADFDAYLKQFPAGAFVALAKNRLAEIRPDAPPVP